MRNAADYFIPGICGMGLHLRLDGFRLIYLGIAVLMWTVSGIFSLEYMAHYEKKKRYYVFFWSTFAATLGVFLSADLYTTFIFFEIMSFTSYVWVAFDEKKESLMAAETYLAVAVIGGLVMLMGLFLLYDLLGTLEIDQLGAAAEKVRLEEGGLSRLYAAGGLLLFGFGAKAGCFPLHIWLPKAHPVAPAPASALLSGILTKAGVFGIIVVSCGIFESDGIWGFFITLLGLATMFTGALLALFSVNLKRTLACSSISQIGFIMTGIGMSCLLKSIGAENGTAVYGAFLHMVNHSLFKLVLFLCAGAVFMNLHQLDLNDIRGYGRKQPVLGFCFFMGLAGISGVPLWSGYVSKTLLHESIVEFGKLAGEGAVFWKGAEWLFLLTGGLTFAYMMKLFAALFVESNPTRQEEFDSRPGRCMTVRSAFPLTVAAGIILVMGLFPHVVMDRLAVMGRGFFHGDAVEETVAYFSLANLKGSIISLSIGAVLYFAVVRGLLMEKAGTGESRYMDRWPSWLDLETLLYRPVLQKFLPGVCGAVFAFLDRYLVSTTVTVFLSLSAVVCRAMDHFVDGVILIAGKTTHRQKNAARKAAAGGRLACILGTLVDEVSDIGRRLPGRKRKLKKGHSAVPGLIELEEEWKATGRLVEESFSFGLMLFGIGLCLTLGYLLLAFLRG